MEDLISRAIAHLDFFGNANNRTYILYLISAIILAITVYIFGRNSEQIEIDPSEKKSIKGFLKYLLPKDVYLHKSAKQDYSYFLVNAFIYHGFIAAFILAMPLFIMGSVIILSNNFGIHEAAPAVASNLQLIIFTIAFALLYDFGAFFTHWLMHKVPILWEFHKVHHSAERLTPITLYRMHPVDMFLTGIVISTCAGIGMGILVYSMNVQAEYSELLGINAIFFAYYIFGYNLRHSHIWLNYPRWLSYIFVSPAQHQIHHSIEPKHWDKNMGLIFAFWDWGFRTLYIPRKDEPKFAYGVSKKEPNPFNSISSMYLTPFKEAWKIYSRNTKPLWAISSLLMISIFIGIVYSGLIIMDKSATYRNQIPQTVHIEDLTWSEVNAALHKGYDRIIIPTGGVEQNGRHMILGKHNYVVKHGSKAIAKQIGKTLVAPVISYVPEEVHMQFPGTISVSEETFANILEDSARSLKRHGFKYILFVGDSSHNQAPQQAIADKLNKEWAVEDIRVAHISDYYSANYQIEWLEDEKNYSRAQIGGHAGIRDTSEMHFVNADGIRKYPHTPPGFEGGDHNGQYTKASKKIGEHMMRLKVEAAVKQIEDILQKD